jgi:hypothetical protein
MSTRYETTHASTTAKIGLTYFAATVMLLAGIWGFFEGLAAVIKHNFYVVTPNYAYKIDISAWGWIHLILGVVIAAVGVCLFLDQAWARIAGIILAAISGVANFLFIPYYPFWSILIIALDVFVIWALARPAERA